MKKQQVIINTSKQDATICIRCGADTSKTMGYCSRCERELREKYNGKK